MGGVGIPISIPLPSIPMCRICYHFLFLQLSKFLVTGQQHHVDQSYSVGPRPAISASAENMLERHIFGPHLKWTELEGRGGNPLTPPADDSDVH